MEGFLIYIGKKNWVWRKRRLDVKNFGPFIVESDLAETACLSKTRIAASLAQVYEGTKPAVLKRFVETTTVQTN